MTVTWIPSSRRRRLIYRFWRNRPALDRWLVAAGLGPAGIHPAADPEPVCTASIAHYRCQRRWRRHRTHVCVDGDVVAQWSGYDGSRP